MVSAVVGGSGLFAAASRGVAAGAAKFDGASARLVGAPDDVGAMVDQKLAANQIIASTKVMRVADELTGTLIDTLA